MTIEEVLQIGKVFSKNKIDNLALEVLLSHVLNKNKEYLLAYPDLDVDHNVIKRYTSLVQRHLNGEPIAYITGEKEFYGLPLHVDRRTLIPRPETEYLVDKIIDILKEKPTNSVVKILDIGTGSGNIAIALAYNIKNVSVIASDISVEALEVAKKNIKRYSLEERISLIQSDLLSNIDDNYYEILVANLPYIGTERHSFVSMETRRYEPHKALFGGYDGLRLYEGLFCQLAKWKNIPKYILGEIGFLQGDKMKKMIKQFYPEASVKIDKDLAGLDRYFIIHTLC